VGEPRHYFQKGFLFDGTCKKSLLSENKTMEILQYVKEDGSAPFAQWLSTLRDLQAKTAIRRRIDRFEAGNSGNTRALRGGVSELKIDLGPGYRVYFAQHGKIIVLLLCGGDKGTQDADIAKAVSYWEDWKTRNRRES
jgi:putative addiction module killer protein